MTPNLFDFDDVMGVLARDVDVRLLNVSASGCLIESRRRIESGTTAALRLLVDGDEYVDDVIVSRCSEVQGAGARYHVGVEYLWTTAPGARSLRRMAMRLQQLAERGAVTLALAPHHAM
jgi:hypothetical protein